MSNLAQRIQSSQRALAAGKTGYDVVIVGGGINGAAVAWLACLNGFSTLLLEAGDFSSGTSSRSSKMIHGGLRYLAKGDWRLTRQAAQARDQLMAHHPTLVQPLPFWFLHQPQGKPKPWQMQIALKAYRQFAKGCQPGRLTAEQLVHATPHYQLDNSLGASRYFDAISDDCALITWLLEAAVEKGLDLCHYTPVETLTHNHDGVSGVRISLDGQPHPITAGVVVNCAGAWCSELTALPDDQVIRPLRGSHLVLPAWRYPAPAALTFEHPDDRRPVYLYPWLGCSVLGTTDLDHTAALRRDIAMTEEEFDYLWRAMLTLDPKARQQDIISSWSGVRPVIVPKDNHNAPSDASREHLVWSEAGLVNLTGGKLTTFLDTAQEILSHTATQLQRPLRRAELPPVSAPVQRDWPIGNSTYTWSQLAHAAEQQGIRHLDDLLLRRTRLGLTLGQELLRYQEPILELCQHHLGWSEQHCHSQWQRFWSIWHSFYSPQPFRSTAS
ncbi:FAD-dependent oxidoreductase [Ferrimonas sp. SCSIO 43195]|uniref:FAD-dependent oxidoreductase n=1 Tax=Ferrimonas sp. SCSIO 43195 TaxID=2822844 RepID=UPI002074B874|nr:FAD-dependent oxidoreductase [Ferrimonas sp. SCSIO 43195]USD35998.1 FAD-dependent oxidoreductase [Ferrimonas sp. SCSIO 43195]